MREITHYGFQNNVRSSLRFGHDFEHKDLERVSGIFGDTLTKIGSPHSLRATHFDKAFEAMEEHPEWRRLSERHRAAVASTLKEHLGIKES